MPEKKPNVEIVIFGGKEAEKAGEVEGLDRLYIKWDKKEAWFIAGYAVADQKINKKIPVRYVDENFGEWAAKQKLKIVPQDIAGKL